MQNKSKKEVLNLLLTNNLVNSNSINLLKNKLVSLSLDSNDLSIEEKLELLDIIKKINKKLNKEVIKITKDNDDFYEPNKEKKKIVNLVNKEKEDEYSFSNDVIVINNLEFSEIIYNYKEISNLDKIKPYLLENYPNETKKPTSYKKVSNLMVNVVLKDLPYKITVSAFIDIIKYLDLLDLNNVVYGSESLTNMDVKSKIFNKILLSNPLLIQKIERLPNEISPDLTEIFKIL